MQQFKLLIRVVFAFVRYWGEKWENNETAHQLSIDFKKVYDSVWRKALYSILTVWGTHETS
jgi:hypothetical protein